jgi:hypothetical protein
VEKPAVFVETHEPGVAVILAAWLNGLAPSQFLGWGKLLAQAALTGARSMRGLFLPTATIERLLG